MAQSRYADSLVQVSDVSTMSSDAPKALGERHQMGSVRREIRLVWSIT